MGQLVRKKLEPLLGQRDMTLEGPVGNLQLADRMAGTDERGLRRSISGAFALLAACYLVLTAVALRLATGLAASSRMPHRNIWFSYCSLL